MTYNDQRREPLKVNYDLNYIFCFLRTSMKTQIHKYLFDNVYLSNYYKLIMFPNLKELLVDIKLSAVPRKK